LKAVIKPIHTRHALPHAEPQIDIFVPLILATFGRTEREVGCHRRTLCAGLSGKNGNAILNKHLNHGRGSIKAATQNKVCNAMKNSRKFGASGSIDGGMWCHSVNKFAERNRLAS
jgi:hypothetical protein